MRAAICGVGSLGCLFGAYLTPYADVTLIGHWPEQIAALQHAPLRVIQPDGAESLVQLHATDDPANLAPVDVALILTKGHGTAGAAKTAVQLLKPDGIAVTLQNGLGNVAVLGQAIGADRAVQGVTMCGASMRGLTGVVYQAGVGLTTLETRPEIEGQMRTLADLLAQAGLPVELTGDVRGLLWGKLAVNAAINPLTALLNVHNGDLLASNHTRQIMREIVAEVVQVAEIQDISLPFADPVAHVEAVARLTAANQSSMLQDVRRGVPTEIDTINGAVIQAGQEVGIPTPVNDLMVQFIRALEEIPGKGA